jgi:hypothetical protein
LEASRLEIFNPNGAVDKYAVSQELVKILATIRTSGQHSAIKNKSKNNEGLFKAFP